MPVKGQKKVSTPVQGSSGSANILIEWKIIAPATISLLQSFVWGAFITFIPLYMIQHGIANPGLFFTAMATTLIAGRALGGRIIDAYNKEIILLIFISTGMVAMIILYFSKTLPMFIVVGLIWGIGHSFFVPTSMTYSLEYAGSSGGTAVGTFRAFADLGQTLGPMVMGLIIHSTGYPVMFLCLTFVCLLNLCYFQFYVRKKRKVVPAP